MSRDGLEEHASFGAWLRLLRKRARLTQRELGIAVGYSEAQITRLEAGARQPDPAVVRARFVEALDLQGEPEMAQCLIALAHGKRHTLQRARRSNLPAQLTSFIGRRREIDEIGALLAAHRVVTLTGSGGVGKTRLALEIAHGALDDFADGVWMAELAPLSDPARVADALAAALGVCPTRLPAITAVANYLSEKRALIVLDNCEHLIAACADLAAALARDCPGVQILATSREALRIPGEATRRVPSLPAREAALLFEQRATLAAPGFALTNESTPHVDEICARLDGIPLAIELAAARLDALSLRQIAAGLDDQFSLLTTGARTALPRHQTLHRLIDWSYALLSEPERALLRRLSVFAGGWTLPQVEALCEDRAALALHADLVAKSLVVMEDAGEGDAGERYRLLETIRQYAREKLIEAGEHDEACRRHLALFTAVAQAAKPHVQQPGQIRWLDELESELDNFRAALDWAAQTRDVAAGEAVIAALWWLWFARGYVAEGMRWIHTVLLSGVPIRDATWVRAHIWLGWLALHKGDVFDSRRWFGLAYERVRMLNNAQLLQQALLGVGILAPELGDAERLLGEAIAIAQREGWPFEAGQAELMLGLRLRHHGDAEMVEGLLTSALVRLRAGGDRFFISQALLKLGIRALDRGDFLQARPLLEESVAQVRELRDPIGIGDAAVELSTLGVRQGDLALARAALRDSIEAFRKAGNGERLAQCVSIAAGIACAERDMAHAARLLAAAAAARANAPRRFEINSTLYEEYDRLLPLVQAALTPDTFARAWAEGGRVPLAQAVQEATRVAEAPQPDPLAAYDPGADTYIQALLVAAHADPETIGVMLCGSRATSFAHAESDYDVCFVLTDAAHARHAQAGDFPSRDASVAPPVKSDVWHECPASLTRERVPGWELPAYAEARVLLDKTGDVARALRDLVGMSAAEAEALARMAYDDYLNSLYRALKAWRRGDDLGGCLHTAHAATVLPRVLFALERRHAPYYDRLRLHLDALAGQGWAPGELRAALLDMASGCGPDRVQAIARRVVAVLAARGLDDVVAAWEGEIELVLGWRSP